MPDNLQESQDTPADELEPKQKQVAIGKNIIQVIGDRAKALFIVAPGLGYAVGGIAVVLLISTIVFVTQGIFLRIEQVSPSPTPWILPTPATDNEILILVAQFERLGGVEERDPSGRIIEALQASLPEDLKPKVRLFKVPQAFSRGQLSEVRALSERLNATFTIWGTYDPAGTTVHFTIIPNKDFALRNVGPKLGPPIDQPKEFDLYFSQKLPSEVVFFTEFTIGQMYYFNDDYPKALQLFSHSIKMGEKGQANKQALSLAYMHRGLAELFPPIQQWPTAVSDFQVAIQVDDSNIAAYNNLGFTLRLTGEYQKAQEAHQKAIELATTEMQEAEIAKARLGIGDVLYYTDVYADSLKQYTLANTTYLNNEDTAGQAAAQLGIAKVQFQLGERDKALGLANQVKKSIPVDNKKDYGNTIVTIGDIYLSLDDFPSAEKAYSEALTVFSSINDRRGRTNVLLSLGDINHLQDNSDKALSYYNEALSISTELGEKLGQAGGYKGISDVYFISSNYDKSLEYANKALAIFKDLGDIREQGITFRDIGEIYVALGNYPEAERYFDLALPLLQKAGEPLSQANLMNDIGQMYSGLAKYKEASDNLTQALNICKKIQNKNCLMNSYQNIGNLQLVEVQTGNADAKILNDATDNLNESLKYAREMKSKLGEANSLVHLGDVKTVAGDYKAAFENYNLALPIYRELNNKPNIAYALYSIGNTQAGTSDFEKAIQSYSEALEVFTDLNNNPGRAGAMNGIAACYGELGTNLDKGEDFAKQAVEIYRSISPYAYGASLDSLGWIYYKQGKLELAFDTLTEAYKSYPVQAIKDHIDIVKKATGK